MSNAFRGAVMFAEQTGKNICRIAIGHGYNKISAINPFLEQIMRFKPVTVQHHRFFQLFA